MSIATSEREGADMNDEDTGRCILCDAAFTEDDPPVSVKGWVADMTGQQGHAHYSCMAFMANEVAYERGKLPWSTGLPHPVVVRLAKDEAIPPGTLLEPGAGNGENALFLADRGFDVTAVDISSVAISKIRENAEKMDISIRTVVGDFMDDIQLPHSDYDYVFERSFLQTLPPSIRTKYIGRVADHLDSDGMYLAVVRGPRYPEPDSQPYAFSESEIRELLSPHFSLVDIRPTVSGTGGRQQDYWFVKARV
ncbi:methyltransferase domain-containing protein [Candidatus Thorarchaeota archaeon]|nr:MAG: methyltransferase domain-containing protein [Candidatus Thorarchaeota archaeon]